MLFCKGGAYCGTKCHVKDPALDLGRGDLQRSKNKTSIKREQPGAKNNQPVFRY
jgi:hypothetical protein